MSLFLFLTVVQAIVAAALVGIALERTVIRFLYGRPLETLLMTWGLGMILQQAVRSTFGATNREVANPSWMSGSFELFGGITVTQNRIWIILFGFVVLFAIMAIMRMTSFGLQMRAVTQNRGMASAMGIRTGRIDALREVDYARLDAAGHVYLDYTGGSLHAASQVRAHADRLNQEVFSNPHSANLTSAATTAVGPRIVATGGAFIISPPPKLPPHSRTAHCARNCNRRAATPKPAHRLNSPNASVRSRRRCAR